MAFVWQMALNKLSKLQILLQKKTTTIVVLQISWKKIFCYKLGGSAVEGAEGGHAVSLLANESTRSACGSGLERKRNLEHSDPNEVRGPQKK
jgi:hypothetical protein